MNMVSLIIKIIGLILMLIGVILIFDARIITKRLFSFGDQNQGTTGLKMVGFFIALIGGVIIYFC